VFPGDDVLNPARGSAVPGDGISAGDLKGVCRDGAGATLGTGGLIGPEKSCSGVEERVSSSAGVAAVSIPGDALDSWIPGLLRAWRRDVVFVDAANVCALGSCLGAINAARRAFLWLLVVSSCSVGALILDSSAVEVASRVTGGDVPFCKEEPLREASNAF